MKSRKLFGKAFVTILPAGFVCARIQIGITRDKLLHMRVKAIRQGAWFRALSRSERAYIELAIKVVERVRSSFLVKVLTPIIRKLLDAMKSRIELAMKEIGRSIAGKLCRIAMNWGNISAKQWMKNHSFIRFLTVTHMNMPPLFTQQ